MKIIGIGVDIVENSRIQKQLKNKNFITRIFSKKEILHAEKIKDKVSYYAKRFAAKEALSKAIGTGFRKGLNFKDIMIINDKYGKPFIKLHNNAIRYINNLSKKKYKIEVSLSDERNYAIANVIIFEI